MTYDKRPPPRAPTLRETVVIGNAARARLFERDPDNGAMRELASFVHPLSRAKGVALADDRPGHAMKGRAHTQFQPHTDPHEREHHRFAQEIARHLEQEALAHRIGRLLLFVSDPFLGELSGELGQAARSVLAQRVAHDLSAWQGAELEHRVNQAVGLPAQA
jgi:protein required for attachment to host cells